MSNTGLQDLDGISLPDLSGLMRFDAFRAAAEAGSMPASPKVAEDFAAQVNTVEGRSRQLRFRLTSGSVDRQNDIIEMGGWVTSQFEKNPVWLWGHSTWSADSLIGLVVALNQTARHIDVTVEYMPTELNPLAETVLQMHLWRKQVKALKDRGGAASVGALPLKWCWNAERGGVDIQKQELLEGSDVILPANRDALMRMVSDGVDLDPIGDWAERCRKSIGVVTLDRARAESIARALDPAKGLSVFELEADEIRAAANDQSVVTRFAAGVAELDPDFRAMLAPVMAASGWPADCYADLRRQLNDSEDAQSRSLTDHETRARAENEENARQQAQEPKAAQLAVELDDETIDALARKQVNRILIARTGSPLTEDRK